VACWYWYRHWAQSVNQTAVFSDTEKANDTAWQYRILWTLHHWQLQCHLPVVLLIFISNRKFWVQLGTVPSPLRMQENSIPQGWVLTLFAIAISGTASRVCTVLLLCQRLRIIPPIPVSPAIDSCSYPSTGCRFGVRRAALNFQLWRPHVSTFVGSGVYYCTSVCSWITALCHLQNLLRFLRQPPDMGTTPLATLDKMSVNL
jgi:hypothetical protein